MFETKEKNVIKGKQMLSFQKKTRKERKMKSRTNRTHIVIW